MFRIMISGTMTAVASGLACSMASALVFGTAGLPFLVASSAGFAVGAFGFYRDAIRKALLSLDKYEHLTHHPDR